MTFVHLNSKVIPGAQLSTSDLPLKDCILARRVPRTECSKGGHLVSDILTAENKNRSSF